MVVFILVFQSEYQMLHNSHLPTENYCWDPLSIVAKGSKVGDDTLHGVALLLRKFHSKILKFKFNALNCTSPQEPYKSIIKVHINYFILLEKLSSK